MKYEVEHTCGHRETHELYGKMKDREWRLHQLENEMCRECARKAYLAKAQADTTPITATLGVCVAERTNKKNGELDLVVELKGGTMARKEKIKSWGFRWGESGAGLFGLITRQPKCWHKQITVPAADTLRLYNLASSSPDDAAQQVVAEMYAAIRRAAGLPDDIAFEGPNLNHPDTLLLFSAIGKAAETAKREAEIVAALPPKPTVRGIRAILGAPLDARWNGKFYRGNTQIYLDGEKWDVTPAQYAEYVNGQKALSDWHAKCDTIRKGSI